MHTYYASALLFLCTYTTAILTCASAFFSSTHNSSTHSFYPLSMRPLSRPSLTPIQISQSLWFSSERYVRPEGLSSLCDQINDRLRFLHGLIDSHDKRIKQLQDTIRNKPQQINSSVVIATIELTQQSASSVPSSSIHQPIKRSLSCGDMTKHTPEVEQSIQASLKQYVKRDVLNDVTHQVNEKFTEQNEKLDTIDRHCRAHTREIITIENNQKNQDSKIDANRTLIDTQSRNLEYYNNLHDNALSSAIAYPIAASIKQLRNKYNIHTNVGLPWYLQPLANHGELITTQAIVSSCVKHNIKESAKDAATTALLAYAKALTAWSAEQLDLKESYEAAQNNPVTNWFTYTIAFTLTRTALEKWKLI